MHLGGDPGYMRSKADQLHLHPPLLFQFMMAALMVPQCSTSPLIQGCCIAVSTAGAGPGKAAGKAPLQVQGPGSGGGLGGQQGPASQVNHSICNVCRE
jgi:hypothetical protein